MPVGIFVFTDDFFSFRRQLSAAEGRARNRWLLSVAGVCTLPVACAGGEEGAGGTGVPGTPVSFLCHPAPVPLSASSRVWNVASLTDRLLLPFLMALVSCLSLTLEMSVSLSSDLSFGPRQSLFQ